MFSTPFSPRRLRKPLARLTLAALMASTFTAPAALAQGLVTLNFSNAEIESVARTISAITGRSIASLLDAGEQEHLAPFSIRRFQ